MNDSESVNDRHVEASGSLPPTWWVVFSRELTDLWIGGKALTLLLIYSILMGIIAFFFASNFELSLLPPKEMVFELLKTAIAVGLFICLIIGADSLSGERERATLEALLLTPASRSDIVVGKFLAAASLWPAALVLAVPYFFVLAQGDPIWHRAALSGAVVGTLLALGFTGVGMLVSFFSNSNRTSYFVSLGIYILLILTNPAQFPGTTASAGPGQLLKWVNPVAATQHFLGKTLVNNRTLGEWWPWLTSPVVFAVLVLGVLFAYLTPGLRLEAGRLGGFWPTWGRVGRVGRVAGVSVITCLMVSVGTSPAMAQQTATEGPLQIAVDMDYKQVKAGDPITFNTVVTNNGTKESPPLIVAMNILNLEGSGNPVDPEDWSPQRTQAIASLGPGRSADHSWRINAILDGNFMVYMVVVPAPAGRQGTSRPVSSSGIHLTITPFTRLNPAGVLPYAIGVPAVLVVGMVLAARHRRQGIDAGGSEDSE